MDEPLFGVGVSGEGRGEELERYGTFERRILGLVDDAHSAFDELSEDLVVGDGLADHGGVKMAA